MSRPDTTIAISFPDLTPAEASIAAQELAVRLAEDGMSPAAISRARGSADAQDLGSIVLVAGGAFLIDLAKQAGKEFVKGAAAEAGKRALAAILRKWGRVEARKSDGTSIVLGEEQKRIAAPRSIAQARQLVELDTLGLVILGASRFPHFPSDRKLDNPAFARSAQLARHVISPAHTVFRDVQVLDLFDQDLRPDAIVDAIEEHVTKHPGIRDVVLYYCGHGDFLPDRERTYYLMLTGTRPGREAMTGLALKSFRLMIEQQAHLLQRRCTFILDCCFAGAAVEAFQLAGIDPLIESQVREILPSRGMALLTAADKVLPAIGRDGQGATMFTGALADVLTGRERSDRRQLSLSDLCADVAGHIKARHGLNGVIPQCHSPRQEDGDVSRVPMFLAGVPVLRGELLNSREHMACDTTATPAVAQPAAKWQLGDLLREAAKQQRGSATLPPAIPQTSPPADQFIDLKVIANALDPDTTSAIWSRLLAGQRGIMVRSIYSVEGRTIYDQLTRRCGADREFLDSTNCHLAKFEEMIADCDNRDPTGRSTEELMISDSGRVYLFLAHVTGRLDATLPPCSEPVSTGRYVYAAPAATPKQAPKGKRFFDVVVGDGKNDKVLLLSPGQSIKDAAFAPEMVLVPPGKFWMGSQDSEVEYDVQPRHEVTIGYPLLVGKYPVTFEEWDAFDRAKGIFEYDETRYELNSLTKYTPSDDGWGRSRRPVINVSWNDAKVYASWLSQTTSKIYRLLSEAEWEYACRAGTDTDYSFGDTISKQRAQFSADKTVEVGSFPANAFGLHDMHGNVWEWCEDAWTNSYPADPRSTPTNHAERPLRVLRGGSWSVKGGYLRAAARFKYLPDYRSRHNGFRLARIAKPVS